jgi:hypothetical protein
MKFASIILAAALLSPSSVQPSSALAAPQSVGHVHTSATWYCAIGRSRCTRGYGPSCACAAAGSTLRRALGPGWRGRWVTVRYQVTSRIGRTIRVKLVDANAGSSLDLYASQFARLAPIGRGRIVVRVSW